MNAVAIAELAVSLAPDELRKALCAFHRAHPLLRTRIRTADERVHFEWSDRPIDFRVVAHPAWGRELHRELDTHFSASEGPLARCTLVVTGTDTSVVILSIHHCICDGLTIVLVLQQLLRQVAGLPVEYASGPLPKGVHDHFSAELRSPRASVQAVTAMRQDRSGLGEPAVFPFHDRSPKPRVSHFDQLVVGRGDLPLLLADLRAAGVGMQGYLAAAALRSAAHLLDDDADHTVCLLTPTDLRRLVAPPIPYGTVTLAIGILSSPYRVRGGEDPELAPLVSRQTRAELARGQSHVFYRLARASGFAPTEDGVQSFSRWLAGTPQHVTLSNLGIAPHDEDPPWLASIHAVVPASSNQLAFIAADTYRGRLLIDVATDSARLPAEKREQFLSAMARLTGSVRRPIPL